MKLKAAPIQRKLITMLLLTSGVVLLLTCISYSVFEFFAFRQGTLRNLTTVGKIIADNSTAALAFDSENDAKEILAALKDEPRVVAGALYDKAGKLFARYPADQPADRFPGGPGKDEFEFAGGYLAGFQAVAQGDKRLGTLYLKSDMSAIYERIRLFAEIAVVVMGVSLLAAYGLARRLQRQISQPILALAETARAVSERRDYSVRASKYSEDELGFLTESFNRMLEQIQKQNQFLMEGEARIRAVIDSAPSAVVVMDATGRVIDWNARAEQMFGRTRQETVGGKLAELIIPPRHRAAHHSGLERFLTTGEGRVLGRVVELSALRRDGAEFPVELSVSALKTGEVTTFCGFITDITERRQMEETRIRLAAIVQSSDDAMVAKDLNGIITAWNRGAQKLFGYTEAEAVGQSILMLFPPDRMKEEPEIMGRISRGENVDHFESERLAKDGRRIDVSVALSAMRDAQGKVIGASKIVRDITQQKQAGQKLQAQLARLDLLSRTTRAIGERQDLASILQVVIRSLEDNLPIDFGCVMLYDAGAEVLTVAGVGAKSQALAQELEITTGARVGIDQNGLSRCVQGRLVYEADIRGVAFPFPQRLARGGLCSVVIAPLLVESSVFGVLVAARRETNGFSSGDCEFIRQLSEHLALAAHQAQLYTALQQAYEDLRQTQQAVMQQERLRALGQMASGIAHDINNAISPVVLYTESLLEKEPNLSARARDYLQTIARAIDDVAVTVARMREFYRQREPQLTLAPVDMNQLIEQVVGLTRARWSDMAQQRGVMIELRTELAPNLPAVAAAESEIREALTNLVFNAVDAMPEGGTLTLRTRIGQSAPDEGGAGAPRVVIEVSDTGVGMSEDTRRRCLEPFFTTKGERGTGLGLAMVYGMVQRHSAELEIDSAPHKGTTVRLIFAMRREVVAGEAPSDGIRVSPSRLRILIVDDDPMLLKSLQDTLEGDGHVVKAVNGGQAGIDAFRAAHGGPERFDMVITDLGMPRVDGRQVARAIKETSPTTPVIMLTGWGQRMIAEGEKPAHVDRMLSKPPKLHQLRDALARCVPPTT